MPFPDHFSLSQQNFANHARTVLPSCGTGAMPLLSDEARGDRLSIQKSEQRDIELSYDTSDPT